MALWWGLLVLGVVLYVATTAGTIVAYGDERVPRLGFWPDRRVPWWSWVALSVSIFLLSLASNHLASWDNGTAPALWLGCVLVAWVLQIGLIAIHNRNVSAGTAHSAPQERAQRG